MADLIEVPAGDGLRRDTKQRPGLCIVPLQVGRPFLRAELTVHGLRFRNQVRILLHFDRIVYDVAVADDQDGLQREIFLPGLHQASHFRALADGLYLLAGLQGVHVDLAVNPSEPHGQRQRRFTWTADAQDDAGRCKHVLIDFLRGQFHAHAT